MTDHSRSVHLDRFHPLAIARQGISLASNDAGRSHQYLCASQDARSKLDRQQPLAQTRHPFLTPETRQLDNSIGLERLPLFPDYLPPRAGTLTLFQEPPPLDVRRLHANQAEASTKSLVKFLDDRPEIVCVLFDQQLCFHRRRRSGLVRKFFSRFWLLVSLIQSEIKPSVSLDLDLDQALCAATLMVASSKGSESDLLEEPFVLIVAHLEMPQLARCLDFGSSDIQQFLLLS